MYKHLIRNPEYRGVLNVWYADSVDNLIDNGVISQDKDNQYSFTVHKTKSLSPKQFAEIVITIESLYENSELYFDESGDDLIVNISP